MRAAPRALDLDALVPVRTLGQGALAEVLLVELPDGGAAALKRALPSLRDDEDVRRVLREEAAAHAHLVHAAIPRLLAHGETRDGPVLVVEALSGATLDEVVPEGEAVALDEACFIVGAVADVLAYIHAPPRHLVHRDLGAHNLMLTASGDVVLIDFGIALDGEGRRARWTATGGLRGALAALSPEAVRGEAIGPAADLFALGALAFELVTGSQAFAARGRRALLQNIATGRHRALKEAAPSLSTDAREVFFARALAGDPRSRFPDPIALSDDFARVFGGAPASQQARTQTREALASRVAPHGKSTAAVRGRTLT